MIGTQAERTKRNGVSEILNVIFVNHYNFCSWATLRIRKYSTCSTKVHIIITTEYLNLYIFIISGEDNRSRHSYEDDYHYDGEREDSDNETSDQPSAR